MLPFLTHNDVLGLILDEYTVEHLGSSYLVSSGPFQHIGKPYFSKEPCHVFIHRDKHRFLRLAAAPKT